MAKLFLLGANKEIDTTKKVVEINQVIQLVGYRNDRYVVYDITTDEWGLHYKLINLRTKDFDTTEIVQPLKEKFGIGFYYDSENPEFMDAFEVAILLQEAEQKMQVKQAEEEKERIRVEEVKKIGRVRFAEIFPENARAVIVGRLKKNESDIQTDYYASSTQRTVILGFSTHKRDIFSEMRKHAANFEGTTYLAEYDADYENREKYSMGAGYYLGESRYSGWIIEKVPVYERSRTIEEFAYTAGDEANIHIKQSGVTPPADTQTDTPTDIPTETPKGVGKGCKMVEYSAKAIVVFGETKAIKEELKAMGGRFNGRLTLNGERLAGWIFPKSKERKLATYFGLD